MVSKYHVQPGDTINKIIEKFETNINGIIKGNDITQLKLIGKQSLLIPLPNEKSIRLHEYKTYDNDTLLSIGHSFNVTTKEIKYFNDIYQLILVDKQELVINDENVSQVIVIDDYV